MAVLQPLIVGFDHYKTFTRLLLVSFTAFYGVEYLLFVTSGSLKTREKYTNWDKRLSQFVYFLSTEPFMFYFKKESIL